MPRCYLPKEFSTDLQIPTVPNPLTVPRNRVSVSRVSDAPEIGVNLPTDEWRPMVKKHKQQKPPRKPHFAYSVKKAAFILGVGKTSVYHLISTGALWTITIGDRRVVPRSALEGFIGSTARA